MRGRKGRVGGREVRVGKREGRKGQWEGGWEGREGGRREKKECEEGIDERRKQTKDGEREGWIEEMPTLTQTPW